MLSTTSRATTTGPLATAGVALGGLALVYSVNPNTTHIPLCPLHAMTGLNCPLCGATRATYALLHGQLVTALHDNAFYLAAIPLLLFAWFRWYAGAREGVPRSGLSRSVLVTVIVVGLVFGVVRNLPLGAWLSPPA